MESKLPVVQNEQECMNYPGQNLPGQPGDLNLGPPVTVASGVRLRFTEVSLFLLRTNAFNQDAVRHWAFYSEEWIILVNTCRHTKSLSFIRMATLMSRQR